MKILFIVNRDKRQRYRFLHDPLVEIGADVSVFKESGLFLGSIFAGIRRLLFGPHIDAAILTGGDLGNFFWYLLLRLLTRARIVLRFGGDPLLVKQSSQRSSANQRNWAKLFRSYLGMKLSQIMLRHTDAIIVVSSYQLELMRSVIGPRVRTLVLAPTISDVTRRVPFDEKPETGAVNLLSVTNLNYREKAAGIIEIIDALYRLVDKGTVDRVINYDVVGAGAEIGRLVNALQEREQCEALNIVLHGYQSNVETFYTTADMFVYSSMLDSQPLVLCEAQAHGLPIIINRWGPFPDMLNEDRDTIFFNPGDTPALCDALEKLITDRALLESYSRQARKSFEHRLSSRDCGIKLEQFLMEII